MEIKMSVVKSIIVSCPGVKVSCFREMEQLVGGHWEHLNGVKLKF